ncbi:MAG: sialate O-acetylesterase [Pirellulaceae bacterium]
MKRLASLQAVVLTLVAITAVAAEKAEPGKHLFILSGQSNMAGLNPQQSFTPAVVAAFGKENVIVVKSAQGGQPIRKWYKKWTDSNGKPSKSAGELYDVLMKQVNSAIKGQAIKTVTFVWMQGERDAREGHGKVYEASLKGLLTQLSGDLQRQDINFVIGRLSDFGLQDRGPRSWKLIREVQVKVADASPRGGWVDTDDLNDGVNKKGKEIKDDLHYSVKWYKLLGKRFADKAIALIKKHGG